jgi:2'-5' RNA ligase
MSEKIRCFIAFDIDDQAVGERIVTMQKRLAATGADLKIVNPTNIHITLRFLGNITIGRMEEVGEAITKVRFTPFAVKIQGVGAFPNRRYSRVVWAGITEGVNPLQAIFAQLEPLLRNIGFAPDRRGFSPHLTIARVRSGRNKGPLSKEILQNVNYEFGTVNAECLRLKRSVLTPQGPLYSTLREVCP